MSKRNLKKEKEIKLNIFLHKYENDKIIFTKYPFIPKKSFNKYFFS